MMSDPSAGPAAASAAALSITETGLRLPSSSWTTLIRETTSTSSHHAAATQAKHDAAGDTHEFWLGDSHLYTVNELSRRNESLMRGTRLGIGFGAAVFAILLIGAVYLGIRCRRKKPSEEGDNFSMEISGVQYEMREEYGPKPMSRCSTCDTDAVQAENSLRADSGVSWGDIPISQDITEEGWRTKASAGERRINDT